MTQPIAHHRSTHVLAAALICLTALGCGIGAEGRPRLLDDPPAGLSGVNASPTPAPSGAGHALVYFIQDGALVAVTRRVPNPPTPEHVLQSLLAGPDERERDAGLVSSVPAGTVVASSSGSLVTLELPTAAATGPGRSDEVLAYAELVMTMTALKGVARVQFIQGGQPIQVPRSDGSLAPGPLSRADYASLF